MRPHSKYKPPGLVLMFIALIKVIGDEEHRAATVGAFIIAALAAAAVPASYAMLRRLLRNREAALAKRSLALCPSLIVFFPSLDQTYPLLTCVIVMLWTMALWRKSIVAAIGCGVAIAFAFFLSYVFVVIGVTLAGMGVLALKRRGFPGLRVHARLCLPRLYWFMRCSI